jgi:fatty acid synthase, animal type
MALYDTLSSLDLTPSGFLGHSTGEILCGFADGSFTAEQVLLFHHFIGISCLENLRNSKIKGAMAAVGRSAEEVKSKCPPGVYIACRNSVSNVTVSGEQEKIQNFVKTLTNDRIFVKKVNSCGVAAHCPLIDGAADIYQKYLENEEVCPMIKPRSSRWVSSSLDQSEWEKDLARNNSIAYHVNNLRSPVLFHNAVEHIPKNAAVVEIAPKGIMQGILKGSLAPQNFVVAPMKPKKESEQLSYFVGSLGQIYNAGVDLNLNALYPTVKFPVSSTTPSLSSLVQWDHSDSWLTPIISNTSVRKFDSLNEH